MLYVQLFEAALAIEIFQPILSYNHQTGQECFKDIVSDNEKDRAGTQLWQFSCNVELDIGYCKSTDAPVTIVNVLYMLSGRDAIHASPDEQLCTSAPPSQTCWPTT